MPDVPGAHCAKPIDAGLPKLLLVTIADAQFLRPRWRVRLEKDGRR